MKEITLEFEGYYTEENKGRLPKVSGVYCVYSCFYDSKLNTVDIKELLYIGESENIKERVENHDRLADWIDYLFEGQTLCYSFAEISSVDRERAEAALIFKMRPPFNTEHTNNFIYKDTIVVISGVKELLPRRISL